MEQPQPAPLAQPVTPTSPAARATTVGTLVSRSVEVWRGNVAAFAAVSLAFQIPMLLANWAIGSPFLAQGAKFGKATPEAMAFIQSGRYWAMVGVALPIAIIQMGALTAGALEHLGGRRATVVQMVVSALRRAFPLIVSTALALLALLLGFALLIFPGIVIALLYSLVIPIAIAEEPSLLKVTGRSRALTKGHRWKLLALYVIVYVAALAPGLVGGVVVGALVGDVPYVSTAVSQLVTAIMGPLVMVAPAVAYHELRLLKEGAGTAELARVFE